MTSPKPLRVAFIHPDLGIGGAERLVVDAALGLQALGHSVDIYTSHHDPKHCFDETKDGRLTVYCVVPPFPRSYKGKFHIAFAHARQLHLTVHLLRTKASQYDVFFVDQLSTCIPLIRRLSRRRLVFYCHFPDKLLANGEYMEDKAAQKKIGLLKTVYRYPMDWLEEWTTRQSDIILANSKFTARVFKSQFPSIHIYPKVVYPGINFAAYESSIDRGNADPDIAQVKSDRPTLLSLNRFEKKKNAALAISSFALLRQKKSGTPKLENVRLVIAGGYDPRLEDNMMTLVSLIDRAKSFDLTYDIVTPSRSNIAVPPFNTTPDQPDVLFLLNFTTNQRTVLLTSPSSVVLLYTPANEHFGIGPVEAMYCGLPVLACNSGGPTESIVDASAEGYTGWLRSPDPEQWAEALKRIIDLNGEERAKLSDRARERARSLFGMNSMAKSIEGALRDAVAMGPVRGVLLEISLLSFILLCVAIYLTKY